MGVESLLDWGLAIDFEECWSVYFLINSIRLHVFRRFNSTALERLLLLLVSLLLGLLILAPSELELELLVLLLNFRDENWISIR